MKKKTVFIIALGALMPASVTSCLFRHCPVTPGSDVEPFVMLYDDYRGVTEQGRYLSKHENLEHVQKWLDFNNKKIWRMKFLPKAPGEVKVEFFEPRGSTYVSFYMSEGNIIINKASRMCEFERKMTEFDREFAQHLLAPNGKHYTRKDGEK